MNLTSRKNLGAFSRCAPWLSLIAAIPLIASCGTDTVIAPSGDLVPVCHVNGSNSFIGLVRESELPARAEGDYVTTLMVDKATTLAGDSIHFSRITDALAATRSGRIARGEKTSAACRVTIKIASGTFVGTAKVSADASLESFPMIVDVPDISFEGSFQMNLDASGKATGDGVTAQKTTLTANPALQPVTGGAAETMFIVNGHPQGTVGNGAVFTGFVFDAGNDAAGGSAQGNAIFSMRVTRLSILGNRFDGGFFMPLNLAATSATVDRNYLTGGGGSCGLCIAGPGDFRVTGNRIVGPGIAGINLFPVVLAATPPLVEPYDVPATATLSASVINNEVRNRQVVPIAVGIRVGAIGSGAPNVVAITRVEITDNVLVNNRFAIALDAGFPLVNTTLRSDLDIKLRNNVITGSCQTDVFVTLTRHSAALGVNSFPYLKNSTFTVDLGGNIAWPDVWFAHAAGFGNTLIVDGQTIPNGSRLSYVPTKVCPVI